LKWKWKVNRADAEQLASQSRNVVGCLFEENERKRGSRKVVQ